MNIKEDKSEWYQIKDIDTMVTCKKNALMIIRFHEVRDQVTYLLLCHSLQ